MKIFNIVIVAIIALLSIAAGLAKLLQSQQEMEFLLAAGLSPALIVVFGLVQVAGGILLLPHKTRLPGALLAASALVVSTILILIGGNLVFGLISTIPVALAAFIIYQSVRTKDNK